MANELGVAEQGGRAVVVGMEECERLLFEDEEDGVDQFEVFGEVVELCHISIEALAGEVRVDERSRGSPTLASNRLRMRRQSRIRHV